jgi:hypothetical protein
LSEGFDRFWLAYPRHEDKKRSFRKFCSAAKRADMELLIASAAAYGAKMREAKTEWNYVQLASTWLHNDRWVDFPPTATAEIVTLTPERRAEILAKLKRQA